MYNYSHRQTIHTLLCSVLFFYLYHQESAWRFVVHQEVGMSSNRSASTDHLASQPISSDHQTSASRIDELVARNAALEEALETRTRENIFLNEMISTVGSTLKVDEVLSNLVDTLA